MSEAEPHPSKNMKSESIRIILATFPDRETARQVGTVLVESQLAACVNLIPGVESLFRWEGQVQSESEVIGVIKTTEDCLDSLESRFCELHPYEVPEFLVLEPSRGLESYLAWVEKSCLAG